MNAAATAAALVFSQRGRALAAVADAFLLAPAALSGPSRNRHAMRGRIAAAFVLRHGLNRSLEDITATLGRSDHSSTSYWLRRADELRASDARFRARTDTVLASVAAWRAEPEHFSTGA